MAELRIDRTEIDGLLVVHLPVHGDNRGWFKENWQREKMVGLGLPDFGPVQNNMSYNAMAGATRGIHAEPWDKLVSLAAGRVFAAWVDLRAGAGFGRTVTLEFGVDTAIFVPRGVANSYQALEDDTVYSYLVNDHWSPEAREHYSYVNLFDPELGIQWPIGRDRAEVSEADLGHPMLADVRPMDEVGSSQGATSARSGSGRSITVLGASGQLGQALLRQFPDASALDSSDLDLTDPVAIEAFDFGDAQVLINAAAFTQVDRAETPEGRQAAWAVNASAVAALARVATRDDRTLVHVSSDYVFDGTRPEHREDEPFSPLGVYGQTKAAGDLAAMSTPRHLVVRTSWVIGDGGNFLRTMARLADTGVSPTVVADQIGRLSFTSDLARGIAHLLDHDQTGVFNLTATGEPQSWAQIAATTFELRGRQPGDVTPISTEQWAADNPQAAPRPANSSLSLDRIIATGFTPRDMTEAMREYLAALPSQA